MNLPADCDGFVTNVKVTYLWEIPNFCSTCPEVKNCLTSPIFVYPESNLKFQLKVYPRGEADEYNEYISLYLCSLSQATVDVSYVVAILNHANKKFYVEDTRDEFNPEVDNWGWPKFLKQTDIMNNRTKFLSDNKLRIVCKITVNKIINDPDKDNNAKTNKRPRLDMGVKSNSYNFEQFFANEQLSDVKFITTVDGKQIHAHKFILASKSKVFLTMFQNYAQTNTIDIKSNDFEIWEEMLRYIYKNKVKNLSKNAQELLVYAEKYALNDLKLLCEKTLCDSISNTNALNLISYAESHNLSQLKELTIKYIVSNMKEVVNTPNFQSTAVRYPSVCVEILRLCADKN